MRECIWRLWKKEKENYDELLRLLAKEELRLVNLKDTMKK